MCQLLLRLCGSILLLAAGLKFTDPSMESANQYLTGVILIELVVGSLLIVGRARRIGWATAVVLFAVFAAASGLQAASGRSSCGCFGAWRVDPWLTCGFDVGVLASLVHVGRRMPEFHNSPHARRAVVAVAFVAASMVAVMGTEAIVPTSSFSVERQRIELGTVSVGKVVSMSIRVTNAEAMDLRLVEVRTSCDCLRVPVPADPIPPGATVELAGTFRPVTRGRVRIDVTGVGAGGSEVFRAFVDADVR